jgi:hypothetical protein
MHLTMPTNRAKHIIGLAVNYHIIGDLNAEKQAELKSLTLIQLLEANMVLSRLNEKTNQKRKKTKHGLGSWKIYMTFSEVSLSEFFYSLHGGLTFSDVESCMRNINDALEDIEHDALNLVIDGDRSWFENDRNIMKYDNDFYHSQHELMQALNNEFETAERIYDEREQEG